VDQGELIHWRRANVKIKRIFLLSAAVLLLCTVLTGCVPGDGANTSTHTAGFFSGVWHGWIAPFSLVYSLFNKNIGIYEIHNKGFFYDLGYYMAIISGFGGLALIRKKKGSSSD